MVVMKVIKVGAVWCSGCLVMRPRWQKIEKENPWLETHGYDYDNDKDIVEKYGLEKKKLPVCIFLDKKGVEIACMVGEIPEKKLLEIINENKDK